MYYSYTHPQTVDIIPQEDYNRLFAKVLDELGITEMTISRFKQMDSSPKRGKIFQVLSDSSLALPDQLRNDLTDVLYGNIFTSLEGQNYADNQSYFTPLRSCSGQLQAVMEDYLAKGKDPILNLSIIGTLDSRDFDYIKSSLSHLRTLDLSDAIPVGPQPTDMYVIPERALFLEDGEMKLEEIALHDSTLAINAEAFRDCRNLIYVFLSKALVSIGASAFKGCSYLPKLALPKTLKTIGDEAFSDCPKLKSVLCLGPEPAVLGEDCFPHFEDSRLIVPADSMDAYSFSSWTGYFNKPFVNNTGDMDNYRQIRDARKNYIGFTPEEKQAVLRMMYAMSFSDNMPHYCEKELIFDTGINTYDLTEDEVLMAIKMDLTEAVRLLVRMTNEKKEELLKKVQLVAEADGGYTAGEKELYQVLKNNL